jgi:adenylate cyclase
LIDATTGGHLWSERYDRPLKDIFALQDEIVQKIVTTLKLQLTLWEQGVLVHKTTDNLEAYDYFLRGMESFWRLTREGHTQAGQMAERAIELDPRYASAYSFLAATLWWGWLTQWSQDAQALDQAFELAQKAVALDDTLAGPHNTLAWVYLMKKQHTQAIAEAERALTLEPNNPAFHHSLGDILCWAGRPVEGIEFYKKAIRLNPRATAHYLNSLGWGYFLTERYDEAIAALKQSLALNPNFLYAHLNLAGVYSALNRDEEARIEVAEFLRLNPNFSFEVWRQRIPFKDPGLIERAVANLRKAGLK